VSGGKAGWSPPSTATSTRSTRAEHRGRAARHLASRQLASPPRRRQKAWCPSCSRMPRSPHAPRSSTARINLETTTPRAGRWWRIWRYREACRPNGVRYAVGVYNLLDWRYDVPVAETYASRTIRPARPHVHGRRVGRLPVDAAAGTAPGVRPGRRLRAPSAPRRPRFDAAACTAPGFGPGAGFERLRRRGVSSQRRFPYACACTCACSCSCTVGAVHPRGRTRQVRPRQAMATSALARMA